MYETTTFLALDIYGYESSIVMYFMDYSLFNIFVKHKRTVSTVIMKIVQLN